MKKQNRFPILEVMLQSKKSIRKYSKFDHWYIVNVTVNKSDVSK